jgi:biotin transport system substrate-specific component
MEVGWVESYRRARWNSYTKWLRLIEGRETLIRASAAVAMALVTAAAAQVKLYTPLSPVPYTGQVFAVLLTGAVLGSRWGAASQGLYVLLGVVGLPVYAGGAHGLAVLFGLTGGYLLGFVAAAAFVGWLGERRTLHPNRGLLLAGPAGVLVLLILAAVDLVLLASRASYLTGYTSGDALVVLVLIAGLLAIVGALVAYAVMRGERRDRLETFLGMVVGVLIVYAFGAAVFAIATAAQGAPLTFAKVLELAIVPFVPADLLKAALAVGVLTLATPRRSERVPAGA